MLNLIPVASGFGFAIYLRMLHRTMREEDATEHYDGDTAPQDEYPMEEQPVEIDATVPAEEMPAEEMSAEDMPAEEMVLEKNVVAQAIEDAAANTPEGEHAAPVRSPESTPYDPNDILNSMLTAESLPEEPLPGEPGIDHQDYSEEETGQPDFENPDTDMVERLMETLGSSLETPESPGETQSLDIGETENGENGEAVSSLASEVLGEGNAADFIAKTLRDQSDPPENAEPEPTPLGEPPAGEKILPVETAGELPENARDARQLSFLEEKVNKDGTSSEVLSFIRVAGELSGKIQEIRDISAVCPEEMISSSCIEPEAPASCGTSTFSPPMLRLHRKKRAAH